MNRSLYQQLLLISVSFTLLSGGSAAYLANQPNPNPQQTELFTMFKGLCEKGALGIGSLLVGKASGWFRDNDDEDQDEDDRDRPPTAKQ